MWALGRDEGEENGGAGKKPGKLEKDEKEIGSGSSGKID